MGAKQSSSSSGRSGRYRDEVEDGKGGVKKIDAFGPDDDHLEMSKKNPEEFSNSARLIVNLGEKHEIRSKRGIELPKPMENHNQQPEDYLGPNSHLKFESTPMQNFNALSGIEMLKNVEKVVEEDDDLQINPNCPNLNNHKILDVMPRSTSEAVNRNIASLGYYVFDKKIPSALQELPPVLCPNGAVYKGQWRNGKHFGQGRKILPDGSVFSGYWSNGMANGHGRLLHVNGDFYLGEWLDDKAHGEGIYVHPDNSFYEGNWFEDNQHGTGTETWADGSKFEGNWINGEKHGNGKFFWADGSYYDGQFVHNDLEGDGVYFWPDGRMYVGGWKENKMHKHGTFTWPDNRIYKGEYANDQKNGHGEFEWTTTDAKGNEIKRKYIGQWCDGKQHGLGEFIYNGKSRKGEWHNGKLEKWSNK